MKFYEITYMLENEQHERLSALAKRYAEIKGWNEKETLQFAVSATYRTDIDEKIQFLEEQIVQLEKDWQENKKENSEQLQVFISDEEREKCRKVVNAYAEELDKVNVMVVEAGRYGFLKLLYYRVPYGFDDVVSYTDSLTLFLDLWDEWLEAQLLLLTKNASVSELDYEDMFKFLPKDKQEELMAKREYFAEKAEIHIG